MKVLVIAPHIDDETLGCGGTLLRHISEGDEVYWIVVTDISKRKKFEIDLINNEKILTSNVANTYGFTGVYSLGFVPATLDTIPREVIISSIGDVVREIQPEILYAPFRGDAHTDHSIVFDAVASCAKWFRYPSVRRVLCYETLSETDFDLRPDSIKFSPNYFVGIAPFLDKKIQIALMYKDEMGDFPFPRSEEAIRSLAKIRGVACGSSAAESFLLLREIIS